MPQDRITRFNPLNLFRATTPVSSPESGFSPAAARDLIRSTATIATLEDTGDFWSEIFGALDDYNDLFSRLSEKRHQRPLNEFLEKRKKRGLPNFVVDVAGGKSEMLRELMELGLIDGGLCINLTDVRTKEQKAYDDAHNIHYVEGDALRSSTWRKARSVVEASSPDGKASLVTCVPHGAVKIDLSRSSRRLPQDLHYVIQPEMYYLLLKRMNRLVTDTHGVIFSVVPWNVSDKTIKDFTRTLKTYPGLRVRYDQSLVEESLSDTISVLKHRTKFDNGMLRVDKNTGTPFDLA